METTPFATKAEILSDLWITYKYDEEFQDFFEYADLGLPLAYSITNNIIKSTPEAQRFIDEAFDFLLNAMGIDDTGFESLDDLFASQPDE